MYLVQSQQFCKEGIKYLNFAQLDYKYSTKASIHNPCTPIAAQSLWSG
jgi:hypothetical protein